MIPQAKQKQSVSNMTVPRSRRNLTVTLKPIGRMPRDVLGHDWVMTTAANESSAVTNGTQAGLGHDYFKPGNPRIIAATGIIGGGETTAVRFKPPALKPGTGYGFACFCPGPQP